MAEKLIQYVLAFVGLSIGIGVGIYVSDITYTQYSIEINQIAYKILMQVIFGVIIALIFYFASKLIIKYGKKMAQYAQREIEKVPLNELLIGLFGLIIGLVMALLISYLYDIIPVPIIADTLKVLTFLFLGYLGSSFALKNLKDISKASDWFKKFSAGKTLKNTTATNHSTPKILDTSVIIDGRIADICKTGFIEGPIVIPEFVLGELRHIADSADGLKRNRGRRGLDILKIIQQDMPIEIQIVDIDFDEVSEVDLKLIKLAQKLNGSIVTNDYNLNKVATLQEILILNINELANAVKPVVLPGEEMLVQIIKEGKESNQGIAYLDDGTMIVVEDGRKLINETIKVTVTSVLQTAAGRMIFAKFSK